MAVSSAQPARISPSDNRSFTAGEHVGGVLCIFFLTVVTLSVYNPASRFPFLNYDDNWYVIQNPHIRSGLTWSTLTWAFTTTALSNWHPLTWLSHALDCQLFGLNPAGHHYINVLLHTTNVVLLFLIFVRETGSKARSLMLALLFALHPVNVESVAWISERKNVLSMLFFLLALLAYGWYARRPGIFRYLLTALFFSFGLMAKPQVVTFPFVLLLWDYWPLGRMGNPEVQSKVVPRASTESFWWLCVEKTPLMVLSAFSCMMTIKAQTVAFDYMHPWRLRLANAIISYLDYLREALWPANLAPIYPYLSYRLGLWPVFTSMLVLLSLTFLAVAFARRARYIPVGWFWFLGTLVPMIGLVQVGIQARADRYAYIPFLGLFVISVWGASDIAKRHKISRIVMGALSALVLIALLTVTVRQLGYWSDNVKLWSRAIQVTTDNFGAEDSLGQALVIGGRSEEAIAHFRRAVEINHDDPVGNLDIAAYDQQNGKPQEAILRYQRIPQITRNQKLIASALTNAGYCYRKLQDYRNAEQSFEAALRYDPDTSAALLGLGLQAYNRQDLHQAVVYFSRAVTIQPNAAGYILLSRALKEVGRPEDAAAALASATRISSSLVIDEKAAADLLTGD